MGKDIQKEMRKQMFDNDDSFHGSSRFSNVYR